MKRVHERIVLPGLAAVVAVAVIVAVVVAAAVVATMAVKQF